MTHVLIATPALMVLVLLWALIVGQPAATTALQDQVRSQSTEVAMWRATAVARPTPTAIRYPRSCGADFYC